jgi:hypothetical protein
LFETKEQKARKAKERGVLVGARKRDVALFVFPLIVVGYNFDE